MEILPEEGGFGAKVPNRGKRNLYPASERRKMIIRQSQSISLVFCRCCASCHPLSPLPDRKSSHTPVALLSSLGRLPCVATTLTHPSPLPPVPSSTFPSFLFSFTPNPPLGVFDRFGRLGTRNQYPERGGPSSSLFLLPLFPPSSLSLTLTLAHGTVFGFHAQPSTQAYTNRREPTTNEQV